MNNKSDKIRHFINLVKRFFTVILKFNFVGQSKKIERLQAELNQVHKMESLGALAGEIAHNFNNFMTIIVGFTDLIILEEKVDNITLGYIREIRKSGNRAASLTQQIMEFSRKKIPRIEFVNLNPLILDSEKMLRVLLPDNIDIITNLSKFLNPVKADSEQIVQVIMNLVINARDSMPDGGKIIIETENKYLDKFSCKFHPKIVSGSYIILKVSDTGCGMDSQTLKKVFDPFFTTKCIGKGTGLGLSTVSGIINRCGGFIYTYSELNRGTTFKIYLPDALKINYKETKSIWNKKVFRGNEKIFLIEDDKSLRKIIGKILCELGYIVYQSDSGKAALSTFDRYKEVGIDLSIGNIIMARANGHELTKTLLSGNPNMQLLHITGHTEDFKINHGLANDKISFLTKPFSIIDIASKIRSILDKNETTKIVD